MSAYGTKRTLPLYLTMSAFGGKRTSPKANYLSSVAAHRREALGYAPIGAGQGDDQIDLDQRHEMA
jgi:hypothetical protein